MAITIMPEPSELILYIPATGRLGKGYSVMIGVTWRGSSLDSITMEQSLTVFRTSILESQYRLLHFLYRTIPHDIYIDLAHIQHFLAQHHMIY